MYRLHFYRDRQKNWRWTLFAKNGKKVACAGEGYKRRCDCKAITKKIFPWF